MRSSPTLTCLLLTSFVACLPGFVTAQDLFPDKGLEAAVRQEVYAKKFNTEPLTVEDVKKISEVKAKGKEIKSLAGLEHCVAVQLVDFENNQISDLGPLRELKLLQSINLAGNQIESVEPLKELERVQYLELSGNAVSDLSPLEKMTNMRSLYLSNNKIENIEILKNFPKAWTVYLDGNPVKNFEPIGQLPMVDTLNLSNCGIESLAFLKPLKRLAALYLMDNKIQDVSVLLEMAKADEERRFSPFWQVHLKGNPVDAKSEQVQALQQSGARLSFE